MKTFEVPGLALAIVKDGKVVVAKGYGVRKLGEPAPVDAQTLFGIASNTKVFTATALGLLVEEGKLAWDAPVIDYLPWFQMYDPVRHARADDPRPARPPQRPRPRRRRPALVAASTYDRKEIARRLRYIKPATSFRSAYAYDNVLYLVAGEVIEAVSGQSWEDFVGDAHPDEGRHDRQQRPPLRRGAPAATSPPRTRRSTARSAPSRRSRATTPIRPAASTPSAEDMAKWMLVLLSQGAAGRRHALFSDGTARQLDDAWSRRFPSAPRRRSWPPSGRTSTATRSASASATTAAQKLLTHTGGLPGYVSRVALDSRERSSASRC